MKKKTLGLLLLLLSFLTYGAVLQAKGPIEINYYLWSDPTYKNIVDTFNASQNEIKVNATYLNSADYETKITTLLAGGAKIDCYMQKRQYDMFPHYRNGFIEPLDKYIQKYDYDLKKIESYLPQLELNKRIVGIPFRGSGYYVYYNKKVFQKANLPTPDVYVEKGEWTWDKFVEVSQKLASGDGTQYGAVMYTWSISTLMRIHQSGTKYITDDGRIDYDEKLVLDTFKMRKELEKSKSIIPLIELKTTQLHYSKAFYDGNAGMLIIGEWFPGMMKAGSEQGLLKGFAWKDWGITRIPCDYRDFVTVGACTFNHVYSRSKNKDAAFKFLAWMGSPEGAKVIAKEGFLPPIVTPEIEAQLAQVIPDRKSLEYFLEPAPRMIGMYNKYASQIETAFNKMIEEYLTTNLRDEDLIARLNRQFTEIIKSTD